MKSFIINAAIGCLLTASVAIPVHAEGLLGGLVDISSGQAGTGSLVNVGLGGGGGNVVSANVGASQPLASANIGLGGSSAARANVGLLNGAVTTSATIGGGGADIDVGLGNPGNGNRTGSSKSGGVLTAPISDSTDGRGAAPSCAGVSSSQLQNLVSGTNIDDGWSRAVNVQVQAVHLCPQQSAWLKQALRSEGYDQVLKQAVQSDALISASLSRTPYGASRVFAVHNTGRGLTVFVY